MTMIHTTPRRILTLALLAFAMLAWLAPVARGQSEHTTVGAADFAPETRMLNVILRMDPEDLRRAISELVKKPITLEDPEAERATWIVLNNSFQLMDKKGEKYALAISEIQRDQGWAYALVQFPIPRETEGMQISNRLFFSQHDDQMNALSVTVDGVETALSFTKDQPWLPISLPAATDEGVTPLPEVIKRGSGPTPLVLIPTHDMDASMFDSFMERNAERYTMYAVTLPGMAGTAPPPRPFATDDTAWIDNAVVAVAAMIREKGLDRPAILGCGLGGIVAYKLGIERGELVGPIITVDTLPAMVISPQRIAPDVRDKAVDKVMAVQLANISDEKWEERQRSMARFILTTDERREELIEKMVETAPWVGKQYMVEHMKVDVGEDLAKIQSPVLIIAAVNNRNVSLASNAADMKLVWESRLAGALRDAPDRISLVFIEDSGQFVTEEKPLALDEAVASFLSGVHASGPMPTP